MGTARGLKPTGCVLLWTPPPIMVVVGKLFTFLLVAVQRALPT